MLIEQITYYLQGKLSESEAIELWTNILVDDEAYTILDTLLLIKWSNFYRAK